MTPIDDELRTALHRRAAAVAPPADPLVGIEHRAARIRRRRAAVAVAGSALAVTAVVLPVALVQLRAEPGRTRAVAGGGTPSSSRPAGTGSPSAIDDQQPANALSWRYSFQVPDDGLNTAAVHVFAASHHRADDEVVVSPLYVAKLPKGYYAYVFQAWFRTHRRAADGTIEFTGDPSPARTVVYLSPVPYKPGVIPAGRAAGILRDEVTPPAVRQISQVLPGDRYPLMLVLWNPSTTGQISYAEDGRTFVSVRRLRPIDTQPGLALFLRTGPAIGQKAPDLIELRAAGGGLIYRGPIDVGPSTPDV